MEKMAQALIDPESKFSFIDINIDTAYKPKSKKIRLVDLTDRTGDTPGGRRDWYKRSKVRETP